LTHLGLTLKKSDAISSFEKSRSAVWPWLDGLGYVKVGQKNAIPPAATKVPSPKKASTEW
jgi:3-isopropylmalate dehydratase